MRLPSFVCSVCFTLSNSHTFFYREFTQDNLGYPEYPSETLVGFGTLGAGIGVLVGKSWVTDDEASVSLGRYVSNPQFVVEFTVIDPETGKNMQLTLTVEEMKASVLGGKTNPLSKNERLALWSKYHAVSDNHRFPSCVYCVRYCSHNNCVGLCAILFSQ